MNSNGTQIVFSHLSPSMPFTAVLSIMIPQMAVEITTGTLMWNMLSIITEKASPHTTFCTANQPNCDMAKREETSSLAPVLPKDDCAITAVGRPKSAPITPINDIISPESK